MSLEMERWDGQIKQYTATSKGSAHDHLFGASPDVIKQLKGEVTEACLSSLLNQVIQDSTFYLASNTHPQGNSIRTVSVGSAAHRAVYFLSLDRSQTPLLGSPRNIVHHSGNL